MESADVLTGKLAAEPGRAAAIKLAATIAGEDRGARECTATSQRGLRSCQHNQRYTHFLLPPLNSSTKHLDTALYHIYLYN